MLKGICGRVARSASCMALGAAVLLGSTAGTAKAQEKESAYSLSLGFDFTSHFISYGADVWGGGGHACPISGDATKFAYGTLTAQFSDQISGFVNVWSDINDNVDSDIGGVIQEVDLNIGATYTMDKWGFTLAHGCWWYAGDTEGVIDLTVAYSDAEQFTPGFAINPSVNLHYRYLGNGSQDEGLALVVGIKPTFTAMKGSNYPLTIGFPLNVGIYLTDDFQGGDSGYGYFSGGVAVSVPMTFIPEKFGIWSVGASILYYNTPEDSVPNNAAENFAVTAVSIGVAI